MGYDLLLIPYMAIMSAWSGGSLWPSQYIPKKLTWVPEALFALGFAYVYYPSWLCVLVAVWSYAWMQSGPGPALQWGTDPDGMGKPRTLSPVVNWISDRLGFKRGDINYCRTWMSVKGFLIGLPVGGIPLMIFWPLSYEAGLRLKNHTVSECLSGAGAGVAILAFLAVF